MLLAAVLLRLWGALQHPFVQDELYTLLDASLLLDSPLEPGIAARPLYYLLQHVLLPVLPETEVGLRALPLLFGVAGVWATWALAREVFDRRAAVVAALLAAIAPWHLYISEMARYWSLVYLLVTVFVLARLRMDSEVEGGRTWRWIGLACLVLGALTHPTFVFPVAGIFLLDAWRGWREKGAADSAIRLVLSRVWLPYAAAVALGLAALFLTGEASTVQGRTSRGLGPMLRLLPAVVQWVTPGLFVGGAVAAAACLLSDRGVPRQWGAVAVAGASSTLGLLLASAPVSEVYTDYAVGLLPLVFVSLGGVITVLDAAGPWKTVVGWSVIALMVFSVLPSTVSHVVDGTRFDLRPAFEFVRSADAELPVYTSPIVIQDHYAGDLDGRPLTETSSADFEELSTITAFWVVAPLRRYGLVHDPMGEKRRWLVEHCPERFSYERPRFDYRLYRVKVFRCGPGRRG